MLPFKDYPIRRKLLVFILVVSGLVLLAAIFAVAGYERSVFKGRAVRDLDARAEMIGASTQGALDFDDRQLARDMLRTLISSPEINSACIYTKDGEIFATYVRPGAGTVAFPQPQPDTHSFHGKQLRLFHTVRSGGEPIGTVFLDYNFSRAAAQIRSEALLSSAVILSLVGFAFMLSTVLQKTISAPLMRLAAAARVIIERGDYAVRSPKDSNDEIGQLTDAFNQMLEIVGAREAALNQANYVLASELAERKEAEAALQRSQAQLRELNLELEKRVIERTSKLRETIGELQHISYSLTHDMRAPLRAMHSFAELLQTAAGDRLGPEERRYVHHILTSARRLDLLIQDAFDYTQVAGAPVGLQPVDSSNLLRGMLVSYPQFQPPQAELRLAADLPVVLGNEALLTQCFSNLLSNAVKFTRPGATPSVAVSAETSDSRVRFWIEDHGIGIPHEAQERIFGMFQRAHSGYEGTGIGLAIVRKAVERMGGRVGVESEPGSGSRFWVELRLAEASEKQQAAA